jgi:CSLREA domain-containing protein
MFVPGDSHALRSVPFYLLLGLFLATGPMACVFAATFNVNSVVDVVDANPGDGICRTAPGNTVCTLRAAIMETNALAGADTINLQANTTYTLELPGTDNLGANGDLDVLDSVSIVGAGAESTIIDGNGIVVGDRVITFYKCTGETFTLAPCPDGETMVSNLSGVGIRRGRALNDGGGGLLNYGILDIFNCAFTENFANYAGGILNQGFISINDSTVAGNTATGQDPMGGGIYSHGAGEMRIVDSTVSGNVILGPSINPWGGGIYVAYSPTTVIRSTISNNWAGIGGGVYSTEATLNLINSTLSGNSSYQSGGGLAVKSGTVGLYNVTITGNIANSDAFGTLDFGGGVYKEDGTLTFRNSILTNNLHLNEAGPPSNDECFGGITSTGNNIVTVPVGGICSIAGSYAAVGASLGPLQNNGGPTQTHALLTGSAALDAGNPAGCTEIVGEILTTDQRGEPRPVGVACDIGAFEAGDGVFKDGFEL